MRILHWTDHWRPLIGGVEVLVSHLAQEQAKRGHAVAVLTEHVLDSLPSHENEGAVAIHRLPLSGALSSKDIGKIASVIRNLKTLFSEFKPDLVHLHSTNPSIWLHRLAGTIKTTPTIATVHTPLTHYGIPRAMMDQLWNDVAWITCVSKATRQELNAASPQTTAKSCVVLNGMPTPDPVNLDQPPSQPVVLCLGRLAPEKGFDLAIRAFTSWRKTHPQATLWIAGDGPERASLKSLAKELHPEDSYRFLGAVAPPKVPDLISNVSFVVMPSVWAEPFGLVAVQAGQASRPVIASDIGGLPEIVQHRKTGLLFPAGDQVALTAAGETLLRDPQLSASLGRAAQDRVGTHFSMKACTDNYDKVYASLDLE